MEANCFLFMKEEEMSNFFRHRPEGRAYLVKNGVYPCRYCQCQS